jgi:hypothetical protein
MLPLKEQVKNRDKICMVCGNTENLTVDHVIPLAEGGKDDFSNLRTLCRNCNFRKGPIPPFWQRIVNLFNGNFYWFKTDMRAQMQQAKNGLEKFRQSVGDQIKSKFKEYDLQLRNLEATNKIWVEKYNTLLKDNQSLYKEAVITGERIIKLQAFLKVEWNEEAREYVKIKTARKTK